MKRMVFAARLLGCASVLVPAAAQAALAPPAPIALDGGPLGPIEINIGADGFGYAMDNAAPGDKSSGFQLQNALIGVSTTTGILRATVRVGAYSGLVLGYPPGSATPGGQNYLPFSGLYAGYLSLVFNSHLTISAGQLGTPEGFESAQDWNNYSIYHSEIAFVEPAQSRGVNASGSYGAFNGVVQLDDGYYTRRLNYLQWLVTYVASPTLSVTLNGASHLGTTGPDVTGIGNLLYNNSSLYGGWVTYTGGNFTVTPEIQYEYTGPIHRYAPQAELAGAAANFTCAVFADYAFGKSPYSLGGFIEYATETPAHRDGNAGDYFGYGPGTNLWGTAITPTWQFKNLFARTDLAFVHINKGTGGITTQVSAIAEVGILY
ncbi:outer membrane beta-barrel protein [Acidiphilium acidophilum]|uniref:outer membrane beta-barrel protein n=1 Tax=Acidiphilium acidophilum TaxID=76588 RepID=UPI002E8E6B15|nr:outer membrane beta-barrel protein [Acidiphilium acidophilum]